MLPAMKSPCTQLVMMGLSATVEELSQSAKARQDKKKLAMVTKKVASFFSNLFTNLVK